MEQDKTNTQEEKQNKISKILNDIKDSEKKADSILDKAYKEKETILNEAHSKASSLVISEEDRIKQEQDKRISEHKEKLKATKDKKLNEGRKIASEAEYKAQKNMGKAVSYIAKKIEEKVG